MTRHRPIITLTTDFGVKDPFAGIMKGVIAGINPEAAVIDLTHAVAPQNVREGAFVLCMSVPHFPKGTVHVAVVDPGVGGDRRAVAIRSGDYILVGPDNGVLSWALGDNEPPTVREIARPQYIGPAVSVTFHGRDIFAPAAAHLAAGVPIEELGPAVADPIMLPFPCAQKSGREIRGEIIYIDGFGNLITNIGPNDVAGAREIAVGDRTIVGLANSYGDGDPGEVIALVGSAGFIEIAVKCGSAAGLLGAAVGDEVRVIP